VGGTLSGHPWQHRTCCQSDLKPTSAILITQIFEGTNQIQRLVTAKRSLA
jgi:alkylation response protein AidB-like acyl-CoA dehydrogenase